MVPAADAVVGPGLLSLLLGIRRLHAATVCSDVRGPGATAVSQKLISAGVEDISAANPYRWVRAGSGPVSEPSARRR